MKSGLEDRNNNARDSQGLQDSGVSMKSGLEDRNNGFLFNQERLYFNVSMKSGLEDRNNWAVSCVHCGARTMSQ